MQDLLRQGRPSEALADLRRRGVTHVVLPAALGPPGAGFERVYGDAYYQVWRVK